jgi:hypothetical protein
MYLDVNHQLADHFNLRQKPNISYSIIFTATCSGTMQTIINIY